MTTWAYKDGRVAVDTCVSGSQCILGKTSKVDLIYIGPENQRVAIVSAGDTGLVQWLHRLIMGGLYTVENVEEFAVNPLMLPDNLAGPGDPGFQVGLFVEGSKWYWTSEDGDHGFWCRLKLPDFVAGGSGMDYALGAMVAGMSAADAVRVAAMFDHGTNNEIEIVEVNS